MRCEFESGKIFYSVSRGGTSLSRPIRFFRNVCPHSSKLTAHSCIFPLLYRTFKKWLILQANVCEKEIYPYFVGGSGSFVWRYTGKNPKDPSAHSPLSRISLSHPSFFTPARDDGGRGGARCSKPKSVENILER